jgi:hypothetical protein
MTMPSDRIQQILRIIQDSDGKDPALLIQNIQSHARSALELLQSGADPFEEKLGFIILALRNSTSVTQDTINGRLITRITYTDLDMFNWAMAELHRLPNDAPI